MSPKVGVGEGTLHPTGSLCSGIRRLTSWATLAARISAIYVASSHANNSHVYIETVPTGPDSTDQAFQFRQVVADGEREALSSDLSFPSFNAIFSTRIEH